MIRVEFPCQCNNSIATYSTTLAQYQQAIAALDQEVHFDCAKVCFFRPFGLNLLATLLYDVIRRDRCSILYDPPTDPDALRYLEDQGFFSEFQISGKSIRRVGRSTSVQLRRLEGFDGSYFESITNWLYVNTTSLSKDAIQSVVTVSLAELVNNVIDHSQSEIGCYICAQYYPREESLRFSVVDLGVGILATLKDRHAGLKNSAQAISLAVQQGVSGKPPGRNIGAGLWLLTDFLKQFGALEIISSDGEWRQGTRGIRNVSSLPFQFPGTCINMNINNRALARFQEWEKLR